MEIDADFLASDNTQSSLQMNLAQSSIPTAAVFNTTVLVSASHEHYIYACLTQEPEYTGKQEHLFSVFTPLDNVYL